MGPIVICQTEIVNCIRLKSVMTFYFFIFWRLLLLTDVLFKGHTGVSSGEWHGPAWIWMIHRNRSKPRTSIRAKKYAINTLRTKITSLQQLARWGFEHGSFGPHVDMLTTMPCYFTWLTILILSWKIEYLANHNSFSRNTN